jgi:DEAD/DEAH box helicase domain-containing protein
MTGGDTLVFDIETSNFFTEPGVGWGNFEAINISVVGVYSYDRDEYACFEAGEVDQLKEWFARAEKLVGFASNRYDTPVLNLYFKRVSTDPSLDLWKKQRVDLLEEIELTTGRRISLSRLAEANLGVAKSQNGSEAITMFREGRIAELKEYCLKDVKLTRELYDIFVSKKELVVPNRETGDPTVVKFDAPSIQLLLF